MSYIFSWKTCSEKVPYIFSKKAPNFSETEVSYIFFKKVFLVFLERYIQNTDIFRIRSTFRTLVYSEPETYSEHCQTSMMVSFARNSYLAGVLASTLITSLYFWKWGFVALYFSYISRANFPSLKNKKNCSKL